MTANQFEQARTKLSPNYSGALAGREQHSSDIYNFLVQCLKIRRTTDEKQARVDSGRVANIRRHRCNIMFISGVPGTGKTATIASVIQKLEDLLKKEDKLIHDFNYAYINSHYLRSPRHVYSEILCKLTGKHYRTEIAQEKLDNLFSSEDHDCYKIIAIDELDILYNTRKNNVLYSLFDWATLSNSKMILIAIANAMDLPDRICGSQRSRLGCERIVFEPYTTECLKSIIRVRLGAELEGQCFDKAALAVACARIARSTGDARKILDACRKAIDYAIETNASKVTSLIMHRAGFPCQDAARRKYISSCSPLELILSKCIVREINHAGKDNVYAYGVYQRVDPMSRENEYFQDYILCPDKYQSLLNILAAYGEIYLEDSKPLLKRKIYLVDSGYSHIEIIKSTKIKC